MREARRLGSLWPDYRTVWRWHFVAGLLCLPFVIFLCVTGTIYLFKPQVDALIDWRYDHLPVSQHAETPEQMVSAALVAVPGGHFLAYELPQTPYQASRVIVTDRAGIAQRVYVDPGAGKVLKTVPEDGRFERLIFQLHGQLLMGNLGSIIMEMIASWTLILVLTGLFLWWPRGGRFGAGVIYPRLGSHRRPFWRDLHAVSGFWISTVLALFLISGLPWSFVWGHTLARVERTVGQLTAVKEWEIGKTSARDRIAGHPVAGEKTSSQGLRENLNVIVTTAARLNFPAPVLITPPDNLHPAWRARSDTQNRPQRISAMISSSGTVLHVR